MTCKGDQLLVPLVSFTLDQILVNGVNLLLLELYSRHLDRLVTLNMARFSQTSAKSHRNYE